MFELVEIAMEREVEEIHCGRRCFGKAGMLGWHLQEEREAACAAGEGRATS